MNRLVFSSTRASWLALGPRRVLGLLSAAAVLACSWGAQGSSGVPVQQAYLKASNTGAGDIFGVSVAVSGETMVVGAPYEGSNALGINGAQNNEGAPLSGAAYVFVRQGGQWIQQAYLKASNAESEDFFGWSVGIAGDTIVVGAFGESSSATGVNGDQSDNAAYGSGAVYVFVRNGTNWSQQAYLKASNCGTEDYFGTSVAVSGDLVVVGSQEEGSSATGINGDQNNNDAAKAGAAYVFGRTGTNWTQQAYLKASNTAAGHYFGGAVAVSGTTVVVGAAREAGLSGATYVFVRNGVTWSQQAFLKPSNNEPYDGFGCAVAVSGDTLVAGAFGEDSDATGVNGTGSNNNVPSSGAAYVWVRSGTTWQQQAYLKPSSTGGDLSDIWFGYAVAVSSNVVVIGAPNESSAATGVNGNQADRSSPGAGAAYVFTRNASTWSQQAYLKQSNTDVGDGFGLAVAVSGGTLLVGAYYEDSAGVGINGSSNNNYLPGSGAAYAFSSEGVVQPPSPATLTIGPAGSGLLVRMAGTPSASYQLQRAPTVAGPWTSIATLNTSASGWAEYYDANPASVQAFYRTVQP